MSHEMTGPAGTGRGDVSMAGGRQGQGTGKGNVVRGCRLSSLCFLEFTYAFWLSFSINEVASRYLFSILIYTTSCMFHICFILFKFNFSSKSNLIFLLFYKPDFKHLRRCKTSSIGQSAGLSTTRPPVRFRHKLLKPRTQIYMDLSCINPQARVLNNCFI